MKCNVKTSTKSASFHHKITYLQNQVTQKLQAFIIKSPFFKIHTYMFVWNKLQQILDYDGILSMILLISNNQYNFKVAYPYLLGLEIYFFFNKKKIQKKPLQLWNMISKQYRRRHGQLTNSRVSVSFQATWSIN